jgi:hypothetical protein
VAQDIRARVRDQVVRLAFRALLERVLDDLRAPLTASAYRIVED